MLETTFQATLHNLTLEAEAALSQTACIFQSARRTAYQRLKDGMEPPDIDYALRAQFGMDARFARDAVLEAQATGDALRALIPEYLANTEAKMRKAKKRLQRCQQGQSSAQMIAGLEKRLAKLKAKRDKWEAHLKAGTLPPVIFGSAEAFHARRLGEITRVEWQARRRAQFWSRGESPRGNQHARLTSNGDGFSLWLATLPAVNGKLRYFPGDLWVPDTYRDLLRRSLDRAYSVRVMRDAGDWKVHITVRENVAGEIVVQQAPKEARVGGLDCNTDCLTVAVASPQGNLLARYTVWMRELADARGNTAEHIISNALDASLSFLQNQNVKCLVVEHLKFAQDHDTQHTFNRRTTRFRSTMVKLATRKALRLGMAVVQVNPAYSSVIGKHKYASAYGMSIHESAAFVLARRGQGRDEQLPKKIVAQFPQLHDRLMTEALTRPTKDRLQHAYQRWASKLSNWKEQHSWSLWFIWDRTSNLIA